MAKDRFFYVIPLETFFKAFLPVNQHPPYTTKAADFTRVRGGPNISVEDMYEPLVSTFAYPVSSIVHDVTRLPNSTNTARPVGSTYRRWTPTETESTGQTSAR